MRIFEDNPSENPRDADLKSLLEELLAIRADMVDDPALSQSLLNDVHASYHESACNLLHYLALRRRDLRPLQIRLAALGLSSLGRAESHVLASIDSVLEMLHRLLNRDWQPFAQENPVVISLRENNCWPITPTHYLGQSPRDDLFALW